MKERPIIFNTEMVRAILDGRKTVTRRPVPDWQIPKEQDEGDYFAIAQRDRRYGFGVSGDTGKECMSKILEFRCCPFGQVGDHLYVREKWRVGAWDEENCEIAVDYAADGFNGTYQDVENWEQFERLWVQSCEDAGNAGLTPCALGRYSWKKGESPCRWRPSIHMPKWAARIWLEITDIRVERVQDITEEGAEDEGFAMPWETPLNQWISSRDRFAATWNSIYGNWEKSPWVWVIEFKRIER